MKSLGRNQDPSCDTQLSVARTHSIKHRPTPPTNHLQQVRQGRADNIQQAARQSDILEQSGASVSEDKYNLEPTVTVRPVESGTVNRAYNPIPSSRPHKRRSAQLTESAQNPFCRSATLSRSSHQLVRAVPTIETVERVAAAKVFLESYFNSIKDRIDTREKYRLYMENELKMAGNLTAEQKALMRMLFNQEWAWHLRETRFLKARSSKATRGLAPSPAADDYDQIRILGKGSFGVVKLVREKTPLGSRSQVYAMKVIRKTNMLVYGQEGNLRAERDLLIAAQASNWIVPLVASFQDASNLYLVMEYMPGGDFLGLLERVGSLSEPTTRFYIAEMIMCIEEAHKLKCIHRDIKPDNFLISASGHLKISDFGLAFDGHWSHDSAYISAHRYSVLDRIRMEPQDEQISSMNDEAYHRHRRWLRSVEAGIKRHCRVLNDGEPLLEWRKKFGKRESVRSIVGTSQYMAPEVVRGDRYDERGRSFTRKNILNHEKRLEFPEVPIISTRCKDLLFSLLQEPEKRITAEAYFHKSKSHSKMSSSGDYNMKNISDWSMTEDEEDNSEADLPPMTREEARSILGVPSAGLCDVAAGLTCGTYDSHRLHIVYEEIDRSRFNRKDREQLKAFLFTHGPEEKRRPRDLLLRSQETKSRAMALRKELAFIGYTWRRRRVYNYGFMPQVEGSEGFADGLAQVVPPTTLPLPADAGSLPVPFVSAMTSKSGRKLLNETPVIE
ncbi:hypothetical protein BROUX41_005240 [Berkeleyomyces rouxiae]